VEARQRIRVLIVDDHPVMARGIQMALAEHPDLEVVGVARDASETERLADETRPNVLLADFHLPDASGADLARTLRRRHPRLMVLMLSADDAEERIADAIEAGAVGYIIKTESAATLAAAIRRAAAGEILLAAPMLARLVAAQRRSAAARGERSRILESLTPRQRQVLQLIAKGLDNRRIAGRLGVAVNTVRGYTQDLLEKMGAHSKLEAVARASELGLFDDPASAGLPGDASASTSRRSGPIP
jgi:DNA-binding NarL/FixJ family response regulator